eukprot:6480050-Amphidinium_carterae.1
MLWDALVCASGVCHAGVGVCVCVGVLLAARWCVCVPFVSTDARGALVYASMCSIWEDESLLSSSDSEVVLCGEEAFVAQGAAAASSGTTSCEPEAVLNSPLVSIKDLLPEDRVESRELLSCGAQLGAASLFGEVSAGCAPLPLSALW